MKRLAIFLLFTLATTVLTAADLSGQLFDSVSRQGLDFANVAVCVSGSTTPVAGTTTDPDGKFNINNLKNGTYTITFSFLGYKSKEQTVTIKGKSINLGKIYLEENTEQLQEVEVVGQGSTMRFELDKKVFSVDQNIASAGGSVTDVLENIPSVDVDQEGNIALRNNDAVEIWINGKPAGLTADNRADVLRQLPADQIKEIEVITNPSAKYSPEGTAGIINLVMKKDRKPGYYGSVTAGIRYPWGGIPGGNAGFNINLTKGIVDAYFNVGYNYFSSHGGTETDRYNLKRNGLDGTAGDTLTHLVQSATNNRGGGGVFLRAGVDLRLTDKSTLGFSGFGIVGDRSRGNSENHFTLTDYQPDTLLRDYFRNEQSKGSHPGGNAMITYQLKPNSKHQLNLSASYNNFSWNQDQTYTQKELPIPTLAGDTHKTVSEQNQINNNNDQIVQVKADYEWKPTDKSRMEAGYQTDISWRKTDASAFENPITATATRQELTAYYNDFLNQEQIHALYLTYGNRFWDKLSVQVGLRAEYMKRHLDTKYYDTANQPISEQQDTSYFQLFPSAYISYSFPKGHELQLNYTRRVDRPRGHQINPRQNFADSTNIQFGNPALLPAYSSSLELNYLKSWEKHTISVGLFYRFADGVIQNVKFIDQDIMKNTFINIAKRNALGLEIVGKDRFWNNLLQLTTSANIYYNSLSAEQYNSSLKGQSISIDLPRQQVLAWSARINASFLFTKTFSGQISARYSSPRVVAQGTTTHSYNIDLGLRKTFFDKRLALSLNVQDLLNSRNRSTTTSGDGFWQYQMRRWNSRTIGFNITYNFGNMKSKPKMPQNGNADVSTSYDDNGEE